MQGTRSSSVQLRLMKAMPPTLQDALKIASQLKTVEEAQKTLQKDRCQAESLALTEDAEDGSCTSIDIKVTLISMVHRMLHLVTDVRVPGEREPREVTWLATQTD